VNVSPLIAIASLFALPVTLFVFSKPELGMMLVIFVLPLEELNISGGFSAIKLISVLVFGCAILNYLIFRGKTSLVSSSQNKLISFFILISLCSIFVAFSPSRTLDRLPKLLRVLTLYFFAINFIRSEKHFHLALWFFVLGGFVCTLYGFFDPTQAGGRFQGTLGQPNGYAAVTVARIPIALALLTIEKNFLKKSFLIGMTLISIYGIILSASRGGLLALSLALILFAAVQKSRTFWLGLICSVFVVGYLIMPQDVKVRVGLTGVAASSAQGNSTARRLSYQIYGIELFKENPILGIGLDGFAEAYAQSEYRFMIRNDVLRIAHNTYLEIATGIGFIGLIIFISILGLAFTVLLKYTNERYWQINPKLSNISRGLFAAFGGFCLAMLFGSYQYEKTLWFLIALPSIVQFLFTSGMKEHHIMDAELTHELLP